MKKVAICLTDQTSGQSEEVITEFPYDEIEVLEGYLSNIDRLQESKFVSSGMPIGLNLHIDVKENIGEDIGIIYGSFAPKFI